MQFEWPPDLEECVYDLAHARVRGGLKRRTWEALHAELLAKVPKRDPIVAPSYHRYLITSNVLPLSGDDRRRGIHQVVHGRVEVVAFYRAVAAAVDDDGAIQELRAYLLAR
jgi:hypothetical protein